MKRPSLRFVAATLVAGSAFLPVAAADRGPGGGTCPPPLGPSNGDCPDEKASNVPAMTVSLEIEKCMVAVTVLGLPLLLISTSDCETYLLYPAHQECLGASMLGHHCTKSQNLAVTLFEEHCVGIKLIGTGLEAGCSAKVKSAGTIEDFETVACP